ncbi:DUF2927 domain-containing protein [Breoghania sp.]|uniref:DUF2927 domain-containing protein n=1 Tax=Breoghania sp. TaxID=2065378 RepID=UPI002AABC953|nr:DUF2927 domain-containing protein [Breoghania sp.]
MIAHVVQVLAISSCLFVLSQVSFAPTADAAPARAAKPDYSDAELASGFMKTVFGLEYRMWSWKPYQVKKFVQPVLFKVTNHAQRDRSGEAGDFINRLPKRIPGLKARLATGGEKPNFRLFIVDRAQYRETVSREIYHRETAKVPGRCLVRVEADRHGISASTAVIVSDEGDHLFRRCLVEEILQGLGPMNDDDRLDDSVFNDRSQHDTFTRFDQLILNMLYHPDIKPGMTARDVKALLPKAIREARRIVQ